MNNYDNNSSAGCAADVGGVSGYAGLPWACLERDLGEVDGIDFSEVGLLLAVMVLARLFGGSGTWETVVGVWNF